MLRTLVQKIVVGTFFSALVLATGAGTAEAGWGWGGSSGGGSSGGYGSSGGEAWGGSSGGSSGGWGGSSGGYSYNTWGWGSSGGSWGGHGSSGGFFKRHRARWGGSSGGYGGSSGGYGGSSGGYGGSSGGYVGGSSGGSSGGGVIYDDGGIPVEGAIETQRPMTTPPPPPANEGPAPEDRMSLNYGTDAMLSVTLPSDAKVYVNGKLTTSTGSERHYISRGLVPGSTYTYEVKAVIERGGRQIEEVKTVKLQAGDVTQVALAVKEINNPVTTVKLNVPEDAQVFLSGNETKSTGGERTFSSSTLGEGKVWKDYTIRVTTVRDGRPLTIEKTIDLKAGDNLQVNFDFERNEAVADAR